jgi:hypothetical protein
VATFLEDNRKGREKIEEISRREAGRCEYEK